MPRAWRARRAMNGARDVAARVLVRVEKERAFAAAALEAELARAAQLDARDRALATELVYGTLRVAPWLDAQLARFAPRGTAKLDAQVRACLQLAAYQLFFMRVPAFAAVNEAVQAVRDARGPRVAAFANAVLRKVAAEAQRARPPGADARPGRPRARRRRGREALERSLDVDEARACLGAGRLPRARSERSLGAGEARGVPAVQPCEPAGRGAAGRGGAAAERRRVGRAPAARPRPTRRSRPGRASPLAILVRGARASRSDSPGFAEGAWSVQEEGSQVAALAAGRGDPERRCSTRAPGAETRRRFSRAPWASAGAVDACDASPAKLERLRHGARRVSAFARAPRSRSTGASAPARSSGVYDRVLVDAPCSGVGTLRRRPEIALRRQPERPRGARPHPVEAIARRAAAHVRPGGSLVYVVCSVLREEGEAVIDALSARPDAALPDVRQAAASRRSDWLLPHVHGTDGYFVATLVRR